MGRTDVDQQLDSIYVQPITMDILEELLKNKEQLLLKALDFMEGKETGTKLKLDGIQFNLGNTLVKLSGEVEITLVRQKTPEKKKSKWR